MGASKKNGKRKGNWIIHIDIMIIRVRRYCLCVPCRRTKLLVYNNISRFNFRRGTKCHSIHTSKPNGPCRYTKIILLYCNGYNIMSRKYDVRRYIKSSAVG